MYGFKSLLFIKSVKSLEIIFRSISASICSNNIELQQL